MEYVKLVENLLNNDKHEYTGFTPIELMLGKRVDNYLKNGLNLPHQL